MRFQYIAKKKNKQWVLYKGGGFLNITRDGVMHIDAKEQTCPDCKGLGFILKKVDVRTMPDKYPEWADVTDEDIKANPFTCNPVYEFAYPCAKCKGVSAAQNAERDVGVEKAYKNKYYKDFDWNIYKADVSNKKKMVDGFFHNFEKVRHCNMGLYIYSGSRGSGKTYLASVLLNSLCEAQKTTGKFINMQDYIDKLEMNRANNTREYTNSFFECGILVIDDFGIARPSETINKGFYKLIDYRINNSKPTIYTSNILPQNIKYDPRIISRIEAHTIGVTLPEEDIRQIVNNKRKNEIMKTALGVHIGD